MKLIEIEPVRTYATPENAVKAVEKRLGHMKDLPVRYFIHQKGDRFFPVFIGVECLQHGIHFHFNIVG